MYLINCYIKLLILESAKFHKTIFNRCRRLAIILILFFVYLLPQTLKSQAIIPTFEDSIQSKNQLISYPIVFFLPETNLGFGGAGVFTFRFRDETPSSNPSQLQFLAAYTLNKQTLLSFPFELYRKNNLWKFKGELSYYNYVYNFYGVGINSRKEDQESFTTRYPRFRLDVQKHIGSSFLGLRYRFDSHNMIQKGELLSSNSYLGSDGGIYSGLGIIYQWDTRDILYGPSKGAFVQLETFFNSKVFGSNFEYQRYSIDAAKYLTVNSKSVFAFNFVTSTMQGGVPFYDMLFFGRPTQMRGYQDRRFIDRNLLLIQSEYRFIIYKRFQGVGFAASGTVGNQYMDIFSNPYRLTYGFGLRFVANKKDQVKFRLDYGRTINEGGAIYLTTNEAF